MMVTCENCDGDGGFEVTVMVSKWGDCSEASKWIDCPQCNGSGWARGEGEPITMDDLPPPWGEP